LPNSKGLSKDDKRLKSINHLIGREVIYTEKLDGENTSLLTSHIHARSEESQHHASQGWVKNFHAKIAWIISEDIQIVGENMYAKHSIYYDRLTTFFYGFTAINLKQQCFLSVNATMELFNTLSIKYVPVLYRGVFDPTFKTPNKSSFGDKIEGYVVRVVDEFPVCESHLNLAKWVRKDHVTTSHNWRRNWTPNKLINK